MFGLAPQYLRQEEEIPPYLRPPQDPLLDNLINKYQAPVVPIENYGKDEILLSSINQGMIPTATAALSLPNVAVDWAKANSVPMFHPYIDKALTTNLGSINGVELPSISGLTDIVSRYWQGRADKYVPQPTMDQSIKKMIDEASLAAPFAGVDQNNATAVTGQAFPLLASSVGLNKFAKPFMAAAMNSEVESQMEEEGLTDPVQRLMRRAQTVPLATALESLGAKGITKSGLVNKVLAPPREGLTEYGQFAVNESARPEAMRDYRKGIPDLVGGIGAGGATSAASMAPAALAKGIDMTDAGVLENEVQKLSYNAPTLENQKQVTEAATTAAQDIGQSVELVMSPDQLPVDVRDAVLAKMSATGKSKLDTEAVWVDGKVYLFTDRVTDPARAEELISHELVAHEGTRAWANKMGIPEVNEVFQEILISRAGDIQNWVAGTAYENDSPIEVVDEYVANLAENATRTGKIDSILNKVIVTIRNGLASLGYSKKQWSNRDILNLLQNSKKAVKEGYSSQDTGIADTSLLGKQSTEITAEEGQLIDPAQPTEETATVMPDGKRDPDSRLSYAGTKSETADLDALEVAKAQRKDNAKRMSDGLISKEEFDAANDQIRQDTGWFQGKDYMWRYEIDDSQAKFNVPEGTISKYTGKQFSPSLEGKTLGDILDHPELFRAYPDLKNIKLGDVAPMNKGRLYGSYDDSPREGGERMEIETDPELLETMDVPARTSAMHEIQHAIQKREGFGRGTSVQAQQPKASAIFKDESAKERANNMKAVIQTVMENDPGNPVNAQVVGMLFDYPMSYVKMAIEDVTKTGLSSSDYKKIAAAHKDTRVKFGDAFERYLRHHGEIESRDVEKRIDMTDDERKENPPMQSKRYTKDEPIVRYSATFASPNQRDFDTDLNNALYQVASDEQRDFHKFADEVDSLIGKHTETDAIGDWETGSEGTVISEFDEDISMEDLELAAALKGVKGNQMGTIAFRDDPDGKNMQYEIILPEELADVRKMLDKAGIEFRTLVPTSSGTRVIVVDLEEDKKLFQNIENLAEQYGVDYERKHGQASFLGDREDRAVGVASQIAVIEQAMQAGTERKELYLLAQSTVKGSGAEIRFSNLRIPNRGMKPQQKARGRQVTRNPKTPELTQKAFDNLDYIQDLNPNPLADEKAYARYVVDAHGGKNMTPPPTTAIKLANDPQEIVKMISAGNKKQIADADKGLAVTTRIRDSYLTGKTKVDFTVKLISWAILSKSSSAFPHESAFLEMIEKPAVQKSIKAVVQGKYTPAMAEAMKKEIKAMPAGTPGRQNISQWNDAANNLFTALSQPHPTHGTWAKHLHELIKNPKMVSAQIRREWLEMPYKPGFDMKILSFALLITGRHDVFVLDRIQVRNMWTQSDYDHDIYAGEKKTNRGGIEGSVSGVEGIVQYEALEHALAEPIQNAYKSMGRDGSIGRFHWESWVITSGQSVSHPTIDALAKMAEGEKNPTSGVKSEEGRFYDRKYGVKYTPENDGTYIVKDTKNKKFIMTRDSFRKYFNAAGRKNVTPSGLVSEAKKEQINVPWYDYTMKDGRKVNKERLDELIHKYGTEP